MDKHKDANQKDELKFRIEKTRFVVLLSYKKNAMITVGVWLSFVFV